MSRAASFVRALVRPVAVLMLVAVALTAAGCGSGGHDDTGDLNLINDAASTAIIDEIDIFFVGSFFVDLFPGEETFIELEEGFYDADVFWSDGVIEPISFEIEEDFVTEVPLFNP
jgi:hypothetical protein